MISHTVPKKLLEQFAYDDPRTKSLRLWQYHKGRAPWWKASPKNATAWEGHFADPANKDKEAEIEARLKREFEDPVNDFIETIGDRTFFLSQTHIRLLTGYIRMLFTRSTSRQAASVQNAKMRLDAFQTILNDDQKISELAAYYTMETTTATGCPEDMNGLYFHCLTAATAAATSLGGPLTKLASSTVPSAAIRTCKRTSP